MAHPEFGRSVHPISTRGDRLCPPNYYWHTRNFRPSDGPDTHRLLLYLWSASLWLWKKYEIWGANGNQFFDNIFFLVLLTFIETFVIWTEKIFFVVFLNAETILHFLTTQRPFSFIVFLNAKTILNFLTIQWPALWVQRFMLDALWTMNLCNSY